MSYLLGFALLAGLVAWVAKIAEARGRFVVGWAIAAMACGGFAFIAGAELVARAAYNHAFESITIALVVTPPLLMTGATAAVAFVLTRLPIKTSSGSVWPVHDVTGTLGGGPGQLSLERGALRLELANVARILPITTLRGAIADGECVRLGWDADGTQAELVVMPLGRPDTPAGRRQQSRDIARRVTAHIAAGSVAPLPAARVHIRATPSDRS
jgi:hypothetical protein